MANSISTSSRISKIALPMLENNLVMAGLVNRVYEKEWSKTDGYTLGQTINIAKPARYSIRVGKEAQPQDTVISTVPITLSQFGLDVYLTGIERTLSMNNTMEAELMIKPTMSQIANYIEQLVFEAMHIYTPNIVGGTVPTTLDAAMQVFADVQYRLSIANAPQDERAFVMSPKLASAMTKSQLTLFNPQSKISDIYNRGVIVDGYGFTNAESNNVPVHTNGTQAVGAMTVNGAGQTGNSITIAATTGTITRGTKITFANVFSVNPQNRSSTGELAQFTVTADVPTGSTTLPISPAIISSGNFQNVTASPANGATITIFGTASGSYSTNVAFHKDAFGLALVPMYIDNDSGVNARRDTYKGISMKVTKVYDGYKDNYFWRFDVLVGIAPLYPEWSVIYATA